MKKILYLLLLLLPQYIYAQQEITGKVIDSGGQPIGGATVSLVVSGINTITGDDGIYHLKMVAKGTITLQFSHVGYATVVKNVDASAGSLSITLEKTSSLIDEVMITSNNSNTKNNIPYSIHSYSKEELDKTNGITLMSRLATLPNIDRISAGIGIGKPVIRGNSFNRILLYAMGTRIENQQWDDRHDLGIPEAGVENVEVVQGPAALIYGADALGGALIFTDEKPAAVGTSKGDATISYNTCNGGILGDFGYKKSTNNGLFYILRIGGHMDHSYHQGGDAPENSQVDDFAANSKFIDASGKLAVGLNRKWGFSKLTYSFYQQLIGIVELEPDSVLESPHEQKVYEVEAPYQDVMSHVLSSENTFPIGKSKLNVNVAYQLNDRKEFEPVSGGPKKSKYKFIGLKLNVITYDVKYTTNPAAPFGLTIGTQGMGQQNINNGKEQLVPDAIVKDFAVYALARYDKNKWNFLGGMRMDKRSIEIDARLAEGVVPLIFPSEDVKKDYEPISGSVGVAYHPIKNLTIKLNAATGFSAPNYAELGTYGQHEGAYRFEIGNPDLKMEENIEGDLGLNWDSKNISLRGDFFYNAITNYIFLESNGDSISGLAVYNFLQDDAVLSGFEAGFTLHPDAAKWLSISSDYSTTRGIRGDNDLNLPFTPADKIVTKMECNFNKKLILKDPFIGITYSYYFEQKNVTPFELATDSYSLLDFQLGGKFKMKRNDATLSLYITNLTDEQYFSHLSLVKNIGIHEMGRNIGFRLLLPFGG
ncbi:MAG: TonB-dependent receptor [Bacteroidota bacterium]